MVLHECVAQEIRSIKIEKEIDILEWLAAKSSVTHVLRHAGDQASHDARGDDGDGDGDAPLVLFAKSKLLALCSLSDEQASYAAESVALLDEAYLITSPPTPPPARATATSSNQDASELERFV